MQNAKMQAKVKIVLRKKRSSLHKCDFELWIFGMFILWKADVSFRFFA